MQKETFSIPNISCGHCMMTIQNELGELTGVATVEGDIKAKAVTVQWDTPASREQIVAKLKEINYPAKD